MTWVAYLQVSMRKHLELFRKDRDGKFRLILVESRIHRLARYYKVSRCHKGTSWAFRLHAYGFKGWRAAVLSVQMQKHCCACMHAQPSEMYTRGLRSPNSPCLSTGV